MRSQMLAYAAIVLACSLSGCRSTCSTGGFGGGCGNQYGGCSSGGYGGGGLLHDLNSCDGQHYPCEKPGFLNPPRELNLCAQRKLGNGCGSSCGGGFLGGIFGHSSCDGGCGQGTGLLRGGLLRCGSNGCGDCGGCGNGSFGCGNDCGGDCGGYGNSSGLGDGGSYMGDSYGGMSYDSGCDSGYAGYGDSSQGGFGGGAGRGLGAGLAGGIGGGRLAARGCGRPGCGIGGRLCAACGGTKPYTESFQGPQGAATPQYAYPYYTNRGPRDFLMKNPPTIGW